MLLCSTYGKQLLPCWLGDTETSLEFFTLRSLEQGPSQLGSRHLWWKTSQAGGCWCLCEGLVELVLGVLGQLESIVVMETGFTFGMKKHRQGDPGRNEKQSKK